VEHLHDYLAHERPDLSPGAKLAWLYVYSALERDGWLPRTPDLARQMGCQIRQCRRYLAELSAAGELPRGAWRWLRAVPENERLAAAMPLAAAYLERNTP
jgi:hypothetical protein